MSSGQTNRVLIVGMSGSGKSHLIRDQLIPAYEGRYRHRVVVNDSEELSEGCVRLTVTEDNAGGTWHLAPLIRDAGNLHVQMLANDPRDFLEPLALAVLELGDVLLVLDEAHEWVPTHRPPAGMIRLYKQGRKEGVHIIAATQSLVRSDTAGLAQDAVRQSTVLVMFQQVDAREVARVREVFPELGDRVRDLQPPGAAGEPPEYAVRDMRRGSSLIHGRTGSEWLSSRTVDGAAAPPAADHQGQGRQSWQQTQ